MAISESLLKRIEEKCLKNDNPSLFKSSSPFSLGMEDWFDDSGDEFQAPKAKKPRMSLSTTKARFELVTEKEAEKSAKGIVPKNTEKNDRWATYIHVLRLWNIQKMASPLKHFGLFHREDS